MYNACVEKQMKQNSMLPYMQRIIVGDLHAFCPEIIQKKIPITVL